jgi:hypothetical protein
MNVAYVSSVIDRVLLIPSYVSCKSCVVFLWYKKGGKVTLKEQMNALKRCKETMYWSARACVESLVGRAKNQCLGL